MSTNVPTFTIPHYEENVKKLEPLVKAKNGLLSRFSLVLKMTAEPFIALWGGLALWSVLSSLTVSVFSRADGSPLVPVWFVFLSIALLVFSIYCDTALSIPSKRNTVKIATPIVKDLDLVEKLEYWLKANYGLRLSSKPSGVAQDLLVNNSLFPKNTIGVELYQDRNGVSKYFNGVFAEKAPGVFELQKASINDTTESVYFTAIPETENEEVAS